VARLPTAPGWYPDGLNPDEIRYWDGHDWTSQWRPRPTWAPSETQIIRLRPPSLGQRRRVRNRLGPALFTAILAAALLSSAILAGRQGAGLGAEEGAAVPIISDPSFVAAANQLCASLLHPSGRGGTGSSATIGAGTSVITSSGASAAEAANLSARAKTLAQVQRGLGRLRIDPDDRGAVQQWVSDWGALAAATSREAHAVRGAGSSLKAARSEVSNDETTLDDFSETNAIGHCAV
jgi:Protein of unknown function (DUF2510)